MNKPIHMSVIDVLEENKQMGEGLPQRWVVAVVAAGELALCGFTEKVTLGPRVTCIPRPCEGETGRAWHVSGIAGGMCPEQNKGWSGRK